MDRVEFYSQSDRAVAIIFKMLYLYVIGLAIERKLYYSIFLFDGQAWII